MEKNIYKELINGINEDGYLSLFGEFAASLKDIKLIISLATQFQNELDYEDLIAVEILEQLYYCPILNNEEDYLKFKNKIKELVNKRNKFGYRKIFSGNQKKDFHSYRYGVICGGFTPYTVDDYIDRKKIVNCVDLFELNETEYRTILGIHPSWFDFLHEVVEHKASEGDGYVNWTINFEEKRRFASYFHCYEFFEMCEMDRVYDDYFSEAWEEAKFILVDGEYERIPKLYPENRFEKISKLCSISRNFYNDFAKFVDMKYSELVDYPPEEIWKQYDDEEDVLSMDECDFDLDEIYEEISRKLEECLY